jgi:hypothetical protein
MCGEFEQYSCSLEVDMDALELLFQDSYPATDDLEEFADAPAMGVAAEAVGGNHSGLNGPYQQGDAEDIP